MWARDNMMFCGVNENLFRNRKIAPKDKNNLFSFLRKRANRSISELFPSFSLMRGSESLTDCEYGIEEENSLLCPICKISFYSLDTEIRFEFFEDIFEARLCFRSIGNRE